MSTNHTHPTTQPISTEKYTSYTEAFREFRMNVAENDFTDDYPETAEMTLAITSGLRYHYLYNYRSLTADQTIQLIETFAKRCVKLNDYKHLIDEHQYAPKWMILHRHYQDGVDLAFAEWMLLCYSIGLIDLDYDQKRDIKQTFAYENTWKKRNPIQLKLLDMDIKHRIEIQQKLKNDGKLVNDIDEFNHIYKFIDVPSVNMKTMKIGFNRRIDSYYDGFVTEKLGTDTIYEWILNDDVVRFQQWYNDRGLYVYLKVPCIRDKTNRFMFDVASHILASSSVKIIRYIIMNHLTEFLDQINGGWALLDPWHYPVNDPECFRLLQECFREPHESMMRAFILDGSQGTVPFSESVYKFVRPEIATAIFDEMTEIYHKLYGDDGGYFRLYNAIMAAKYGHIEPIETTDWSDLSVRLMAPKDGTNKLFGVREWLPLFWGRNTLIGHTIWNMPFGMNPSTAAYLHDLFAENNVTRILLDDQTIEQLDGERYWDDHSWDIRNDKHLTMAEFEEEESVCTDDELY